MNNILKMVDWLIRDSGLKQKEIAAYAGVAQSTISRVYRGEQKIDSLKTATVAKIYEQAYEVYNRMHPED